MLNPHLSWQATSNVPDDIQTAWRIIVSTEKEKITKGLGDVWDSGCVESSRSWHHPYAGKPLESCTRYWFRVSLWDSRGKCQDSDTSWWETSFLNPFTEWTGQWIGDFLANSFEQPDPTPEEGLPSPKLLRNFNLSKPVQKARFYATALGLYHAELNGISVTDSHFNPGWTDYRIRLHYQTFDVTTLLKNGDNHLSALLGDGWYAGHLHQRGRHYYGSYPLKFNAMLRIEFSDGSILVLNTDNLWTASSGPLVRSDILMGESFDGRIPWSIPEPVEVFENEYRPLHAHTGPLIRTEMELTPKEWKQLHPDTWIFDLGQNMVGWARLQTKGPAGTRIKLRFGEMISLDGNLYTENLRTALQTDTVILPGGEMVWEPNFTYHGFRYIEVTGLVENPTEFTITGLVVHSDTPMTGHFSCSNQIVNQLFSNIVWGQRGNFFSIPTDCPQRDERLGWTGDTVNFLRTANFDMDCELFYRKYMDDIVDAQQKDGAYTDVVPQVDPFPAGHGGWGDAGVMIPWYMYRVYGDRRLMEKHWLSMKRFINYCTTNSRKGIRPEYVYGDWLNHNAPTPTDLINTAWYAGSISLMARMARVLEKPDDETRYKNLFASVARAFRHHYVAWNGKIKGNTQAAYVLALAMNLLTPRQTRSAVRRLADDIRKRKYHQSTGFVSTSFLLPILTKHGQADIAYQIVNNITYPSWGYSIVNGATTIWERWNSYTHENGFEDPAMNSFNHYSLGSVGEWLFEYAAGIRVELDTEKTPIIHLNPMVSPTWTFAEARYESIIGTIESRWIHKNGKTIYRFKVPTNARAVITLGNRVYHVGSGIHEF